LFLERFFIIRIFVITAILSGAGLFTSVLTEQLKFSFDELAHDWAVTRNLRNEWQHTALLYMDNGVPLHVSRKQSVGLYAQAAENLLNAGAVAVLFDGTLYEFNKQSKLASCLEQNNVKWRSLNRFNPLQNLSRKNFTQFLMPKPANNVPLIAYVSPTIPYPIWSSYSFVDLRVAFSDTKDFDRLLRLQSIYSEHGAYRLAAQLTDFEKFDWRNSIQSCTQGQCIRVKQSLPVVQHTQEKPLLKLSQWAQCSVLPDAANVAGKLVVMQLSSLNEPTDIHLTPLSHHFAGSHLVSGAQFLVDATETLLQQDMPLNAPILWSAFVTLLLALILLVCGFILPSSLNLIISLLAITLVLALPLLTPFAIWPISFMVFYLIFSNALSVLYVLSRNKKSVKLVKQYLPEQLQKKIAQSGNIDMYIDKRVNAVVLLSDLQSYTKISDTLNDPALLFELLNSYYSEVTRVLQTDYQGWLEGYAGDQFIFYWPIFDEKDQALQVQRGIDAGHALEIKQRKFFKHITESEHLSLNQSQKKIVQQAIGAGIGISYGEVVMGNLGNKSGLMQFGIIGQAINVASRLEGLSRTFTHKVYINSMLYDLILEPKSMQKFIKVRLKGWIDADWIYVPFTGSDLSTYQQQWDTKRDQIEQTGQLTKNEQDENLLALQHWHQLGLWNAEEQYWDIHPRKVN
jgi:adenylate cyclase